MEYNNSKKAIYTPLIGGLILIIGIIIGHSINKGTSNFYSHNNKITPLLDLINSKYVDKVDTDSLIEKAIPKILESLDPHTIYISASKAKEHDEPLNAQFDGIGVQFTIKDDTILIINTIAGGPSKKLGILPGDRIITINDSLFAGVKIKNSDVVKNLKGKRGTKVKIGVKRRSIKNLIHFEITRAPIPLFSIDASFMLTKDIAYIKISNFSATTFTEFVTAEKKLLKQGMKKLILDLRQNGGGYLHTSTSIADEFLPKGKMIVYTKGINSNYKEYKATDAGLCEDIEIEVLIDSWSASASEILAGSIQDNDRGTIIGRRSFGKGLVQRAFTFFDKSEIVLTIARYYTASGRCIQKPYNKGRKSYSSDFYHRIATGELKNADSTIFADSLKFKTPKGKTVYGGGGIMPDIFVPIDTVGYSKYYDNVISKQLIYNFSLDYVDKNRKLLSNYKTTKSINKYLKEQNITKQFINYAEKKGVKKDPKGLKISGKTISARLRATIARNLLNDNSFYQIIGEVDNVLKRAVEEFEK